MEASSITTTGLIVFALMGSLVLVLRREVAFIPIILICCYFTLSERLVIIGLHFSVLRLLVLVGCIRLLFRKEFHLIRLNSSDKAIIVYVLLNVVMYTILYMSSDALVNRLGFAYDLLGLYFYFRCTIVNLDDVGRLLRFLGWGILPLACLMLFEQITGRNPFSILGGVPEFSMIRDGSLRAQGPFRHPILAGTLGATIMPLFIGLWYSDRKNRNASVCGFLSSTIIVIVSSSSGPIIACVSEMLALYMWRFRQNMRQVRWSIVCALVVLHSVMTAPIWYLIGRVSLIIGGTGWHRSELIDEAIKHFNEWWLVGTTFTAHWAQNNELTILPDTPSMVDITNQFILIGVFGGILPLVAFVAVITCCFSQIGLIWRAMENERLSSSGIFVWSLGASLVGHVTSFLSVAYFDQLIAFWYLLLASISSLYQQSSSHFNQSYQDNIT